MFITEIVILQMELCSAAALNQSVYNTSQMKLIMDMYNLVSLYLHRPIAVLLCFISRAAMLCWRT